MKIAELKVACAHAVANNGSIALVSQDKHAPFPRKGWPKGELMCVNEVGQSVWLYNAQAILDALERHKDELGADS